MVVLSTPALGAEMGVGVVKEFKVILGYVVTSRPAWITRNLVSKINRDKKEVYISWQGKVLAAYV